MIGTGHKVTAFAGILKCFTKSIFMIMRVEHEKCYTTMEPGLHKKLSCFLPTIVIHSNNLDHQGEQFHFDNKIRMIFTDLSAIAI